MTFQLLTANIALNGFSNVWTYNQALGSNARNASVYGPDLRAYTVPSSQQVLNQWSPTEAAAMNMAYMPGKEQVDITTLDSLELRSLDLLKIDVEDMEVDVISGGLETLRRLRPTVWAESLQHFQKEDRQFVTLMSQLGYSCSPVGGMDIYELLCKVGV